MVVIMVKVKASYFMLSIYTSCSRGYCTGLKNRGLVVVVVQGGCGAKIEKLPRTSETKKRMMNDESWARCAEERGRWTVMWLPMAA